MLQHVIGRRRRKRLAVLLAPRLLCGCTSIGDLGYVQPPAVADNIHAWVGQEAALHAGGPISLNNLTEDERTLRDLAFPLIAPPNDRERWDAVVFEYGEKRDFRRNLWVVDPGAYYGHLMAVNYRSTAARYNQLNDDIRNDIVRIPPFFDIARRVIEADRARQVTMEAMADLTPPERFNAVARIAENNLTIAWVETSLSHRCAGYRYALNRLVVSEPEALATNVDVSLGLLQQNIAANQVVPTTQFAAALPPVAVAVQPPPIVK